MGISGMADSFVEGCKEFVYAAVVIGLARGILVVAENGRIIDTLLFGLSEMLEGLPQYAFTTLMLLGHNVITFLCPHLRARPRSLCRAGAVRRFGWYQ